MSTLLSFARAGPAHRAAPRDEEANVAVDGAPSTSSSRWSRPFARASNWGSNVEMRPHPAPEPTRNPDLEQATPAAGGRHERTASALSFLSAVHVPSLSTLRQRDRDNERRRQNQRANNPDQPIVPALATVTTVTPASRSANKKSRSSRREREEAATLFGPNLANYFGSGISSSGAVSSHGAGVPQPPPVTSPVSPTAAPDSAIDPTPSNNAIAIATATADSAYPQTSSSRRVRLGSRGRARGASLSGLSMMSLGAESVTSLGGLNLDRSNDAPAQAHGMIQGSTADLIDQLNRDAGPNTDGHIAMSEGVDITTLQRWIHRSTGNPDAALPVPAAAAAAATYGPPVCTTLQSFVNLKRNTLKLSPKTNVDAAKPAEPDANFLRSRPSLSLLPTLSYASTGAASTATSLLPEPTHSLYFEYDCAAPYASVQIFIRASRKHGSWLNYQPPSANTGDPLAHPTNPDGSPAWLAQCAPPPHVLGWPVHVAKLSKGFGVGHTATIPLDLAYYAPPRRAKLDANTAGASATAGETGDKIAAHPRITSTVEPVTPAAIPETPGFEFQRRLELDADDADDDGPPARHARAGSSRAAGAGLESGAGVREVGSSGAVALSAEVAAQPAVEEETKEQRLAREKAERETLKLAIVVEALDEHARPLREPNLQTSYLRLTSLPVKRSVSERLTALTTDASTPEVRIWSSQVEGQEAEIGPHRFQLQELYGLSSKPPAVAPAPPEGEEEEAPQMAMVDASSGSECLICLSSPPTTLLLPCTHGLCLECAVQLRDSVVGIRQSERRRGRTPRRKYACPVCRRAYTSMLHLSKADEKSAAQTAAPP